MVTRVEVAPDLLRWAVERAGWDDATTSRRAPQLDSWIEGNSPTLKQLEKFASDTHTPFGLFFLPEPPVEEIPIPDMRTFGNAAVGTPSADLLDTIYICQTRQEWFRHYALDHALPAPWFVGTATPASRPELVADRIRDLLGFDLAERGVFQTWEEALRRLIDQIEGTGVLVMVSGVVGANPHRKLRPSEFRGFALADALAPLIFVNGADTKAAQIFTIIHEFAHVWVGESALSDASMLARGGLEEELWCNRVAAEVLVPLATLRTEYRGDASVRELERLAKLYRVSTLVVLKRVHDAGLLTWDEYNARYDTELSRVTEILTERRNESSGGNYYYTQPIRLSRQFARAVVASTFEGTTTFRDAYQLLGTKKHETFKNLALELGVA